MVLVVIPKLSAEVVFCKEHAESKYQPTDNQPTDSEEQLRCRTIVIKAGFTHGADVIVDHNNPESLR